MHEIELKARLENPEEAERRLLRFADFSVEYVKTDQYWTIGDKTIRIRQETTGGRTAVFVTQKVRTFKGTMESNRELEFELSAHALPVFTAILENTGFIPAAQKRKFTKVFIPHKQLFEERALLDVQKISAEISRIDPIGTFLEVELLYAEQQENQAEADIRFSNARTIINTLLSLLEIPQTAVETRPYSELLQAAGALNGSAKESLGHTALSAGLP